jgi:hypothetical protein
MARAEEDKKESSSPSFDRNPGMRVATPKAAQLTSWQAKIDS